MADIPDRMLLIVTGSTLRAEEVDRPLAYYLKQRIEEKLSTLPIEPIEVRVLADFRWLNDDPLQGFPTISVGGPGVNALAGQFFEQLPFTLAIDEEYCIQMDPEPGSDPRVSIWGMDNPKTQLAVSVFVERYLPRFLDVCSKLPFDPPPFLHEDDDEDEDDDET